MLRPTSALSGDELVWVRRFLAERPLFALYFDSAIEDLDRGLDNREVHIGEDRLGLILGIAFEGLTVRTAIGQLSPTELQLLPETPMPAELHVEAAHEPVLADLCRDRLLQILDMRSYRRAAGGAGPDPGARDLTIADRAAVQAFVTAHNPRNVFSDWMLALPFAAIEENGAIVATAGTIVMAGGRALIGNFLTRPDCRGRGLARRLALHLAARLGESGVAEVFLATTADNLAACRAYERAGYTMIEARRQWDLKGAA
jgi:ribosomal protein S18 acetylase RimI-like enzyme